MTDWSLLDDPLHDAFWEAGYERSCLQLTPRWQLLTRLYHWRLARKWERKAASLSLIEVQSRTGRLPINNPARNRR